MKTNGMVAVRRFAEAPADRLRASGWVLLTLQCAVLLLTLTAWGELQFVALPAVRDCASETARQRDQARTLSDAAGVLTQREGELLARQKELRREVEATLDRIKDKGNP